MAKAEASVEELVGMIERAEVRLPEMQRQHVWQAARVRDLMDSRYRGYQFKKTFNDKMAAFGMLAGDLSQLVQQLTEIRLEAEEDTGAEDEAANERMIHELNREEKHSIDEDFTYRRPHGFILDGQAVTGVVTWKRLYLRFCNQLHTRDRDRFTGLHVADHGMVENL